MKKLLLLGVCLCVGFLRTQHANAADAEIEWLLATIEGSSDFTNAGDPFEISRKLGRFGCSASEDVKASPRVVEVKCDESRVMSRVNFLRVNKLLGRIPEDFASTHPAMVTGQLLFISAFASIDSYFKDNTKNTDLIVIGTYVFSDQSYKRSSETVFKTSLNRDDFTKATSNKSGELLSMLASLPGFHLSDWYQSRLKHEMQ